MFEKDKDMVMLMNEEMLIASLAVSHARVGSVVCVFERSP